jgi:hypothetical protein
MIYNFAFYKMNKITNIHLINVLKQVTQVKIVQLMQVSCRNVCIIPHTDSLHM